MTKNNFIVFFLGKLILPIRSCASVLLSISTSLHFFLNNIESIKTEYACSQVTMDQWKSRLEEHCLDAEDISRFWIMVESGMAPYHAFSLVVSA